MHGPTPLFLTRSINQHRKKYTDDGMRTAAERLLIFIIPALYRCDHVVPHSHGVIQSTACEEPNLSTFWGSNCCRTNYFFRQTKTSWRDLFSNMKTFDVQLLDMGEVSDVQDTILKIVSLSWRWKILSYFSISRYFKKVSYLISSRYF